MNGTMEVTKAEFLERLSLEKRPEYCDLIPEGYPASAQLDKKALGLAEELKDLDLSTTSFTSSVKSIVRTGDHLQVVICICIGSSIMYFYTAEQKKLSTTTVESGRSEWKFSIWQTPFSTVNETVDPYVAVNRFTHMANYEETPDSGTTPLSRNSVVFLTRMVISELDELLATVESGTENRTELLKECVDSRDRTGDVSYESYLEQASLQADAMVDYIYYTLNIACKHNLELSEVFRRVHSANMSKADPETGKFIKRASDGKIIKPEGWKSPDIYALLDYLQQERNH